ncbi:ribosomal protein L11 methyltransferase [Citrobacter koseri]|nr:ribosomal protein L11 methyltransferase [Citrobacter koseri]
MPWIQLKLNTTGTNAEELSDALVETGAVLCDLPGHARHAGI